MNGLGLDCVGAGNENYGSVTVLACTTVMLLPFIRMVKMRERTTWGGVGRNQALGLVYVRTEMSGRPSLGNAKVRGHL